MFTSQKRQIRLSMHLAFAHVLVYRVSFGESENKRSWMLLIVQVVGIMGWGLGTRDMRRPPLPLLGGLGLRGCTTTSPAPDWNGME